MLNKIRKLREKKGFTLVELIVVIAIIAILTAVLVPLIGNWTQQAAYTTLQDGAQTISNTVNEAISKVVAGGAPLTGVATITGTKSASGADQLKISILDSSGNALGSASNMTSNKATFDAISTPTVHQKVAYEIAKMLDATMPNTCAFTATITSGAVGGVIYNTTNSTVPAEVSGSNEVTTIDGFDNAYQLKIGGADTAVGVTGQYKK